MADPFLENRQLGLDLFDAMMQVHGPKRTEEMLSVINAMRSEIEAWRKAAEAYVAAHPDPRCQQCTGDRNAWYSQCELCQLISPLASKQG